MTVSYLCLACVQMSPLPQRKSSPDFFWGRGDVCTQANLCPNQSNFLSENVKVIPTTLLPRIKEIPRCKMGVGVQRERKRERQNIQRNIQALKHEEWRHFLMIFCFYTESATRRSRRIADQVWRNIYSFPAAWVTDALQWPPAPMTHAQRTNYLLSGLWSLNERTLPHRLELYNPGQNVLGHLRKLGTMTHFAKLTHNLHLKKAWGCCYKGLFPLPPSPPSSVDCVELKLECITSTLNRGGREREDASIWRAIALVSQEFWPRL